MEGPPVLPTEPKPAPLEPRRRELTCVLFPGVVRDHERAMECLGGIREISTVYSNPTKKRLGLTFSPENPFAKKTFGDRSETSGLLLRVRVRKRTSPGGIVRETLSTHIVGEINMIYKFESMLDFALLPAPLTNAPGAARCVYQQLVPSGRDSLDWLHGPAPFFIVPAHFTRSDKPHDYRYSDKKYPTAHRELSTADQEHHHRVRAIRSTNIPQVQFSLSEALPTEAPAAALRALHARIASVPSLAGDAEVVRKMFEDRPIWSKNALSYHTKLCGLSLKYILPTLANYFRGGPWRQLWVRLGYDPRLRRDAMIYQTLDFRMRKFDTMSGVRARVHLHKKLTRPSERRNPFAEEDGAAHMPEAAVVFRPGLTPNQRQIFYQFCDIKVPEVEETLARLAEGGEGAGEAVCHARRGWLPAGLHDRVRATLLAYTRRTARRRDRDSEAAAEEGSEESGAEGGGGEAEEGGEYIVPEMLDT